MEVLNKKERLSSFLLFLLMFIITVGLLFAAFFFSYKLPWKENAVLRTQNEKLQYEYMYQKKFIRALENVDTQIDSLDTVNEGYYFVEQSIIKDLINLRGEIPKDSLDDRSMYENLILTYNKLVDAKRDLKKVATAKKEVLDLKEDVAAYQNEIKQLNTALDLCRRLN